MLLTMMNQTGERSGSHGLATDVLLQQSASLGIPLTMRSTSWDDYERIFVDALIELRGNGIEHGIFGDIDLEEHREWVWKVCKAADVNPVHPLWKEDRASLLNELLRDGFEATIIAAKDKVLGQDVLGQRLTPELVDKFRESGIDPSGEAGEYHTVVTGGPLFSTPLSLAHKEVVHRDGYWFLDVACL